MAAVLYAKKGDLQVSLSPATVLALYDDDSRGAISEAAIEGVLARASRWVDSYLARVYVGPFPVTQVPVPEIIKDATLEFAIAFSFERHPEYVHTYGESYRATTRFKRACEMMDRLCQGQQEIPDWILQPKPKNVGGIIYDDSTRTATTSMDGTKNGDGF